MRLTRRKLPPGLREALRAAERHERGKGPWRSGAWLRQLRRVPLAGWFLLLFLAVLAAGESGLLLRREAQHPGQGSASLPRVLYGIPEGTTPPAQPRSGVPARDRFTARVTVVDGDTLAAGGARLRVYGVDAPELGQTCQRRAGDYPCGEEARRAMAGILRGGAVACEALDTDRYGRRIVRCRNAEGTDIGAELVRQGWAVAFTRFSADYVGQEAEARAAGRGLWAGRFETPSEWRARHRQ